MVSEKTAIFDSITHPTVNGDWIEDRFKGENHLNSLLKQMVENDVRWALAVGMQGIGGYDEGTYSSFVLSHAEHVYPVAYFHVEDNVSLLDITSSLKRIKKLKYIGIKIHPRFSKININQNKILSEVIKRANDVGLAVLFCSHLYDKQCWNNNLDSLARLFAETNGCKMIVMHAGIVRLLEMMELAKLYPNLLLDLSYTICKYEGSSLDLDIHYLFKNFDRRICVGSDSPEFKLSKLRERFEHFSSNIELSKRENIAYKNIKLFLGV